jgi:hypothetical protein
VCHASATRATDPDTIPAHSLIAKSSIFPIIEKNPANLAVKRLPLEIFASVLLIYVVLRVL